MPGTGSTDVKNWPDLVFKFLLSLLGSAIFIAGTYIISELKEVNKGQSNIKDLINAMDKRVEKVTDAVSYLRDDVTELKEENKELRQEIERLKEFNRGR